MYIVNVNNFRPFDLFILLNAAFRNSNIAFSHAALDICLRRAYNALKRTVRQCPSGSYGDAEAAAGYNYKAYFVIPLFICVGSGPRGDPWAAVAFGKKAAAFLPRGLRRLRAQTLRGFSADGLDRGGKWW